jgi:hypothetical protein
MSVVSFQIPENVAVLLGELRQCAVVDAEVLNIMPKFRILGVNDTGVFLQGFQELLACFQIELLACFQIGILLPPCFDILEKLFLLSLGFLSNLNDLLFSLSVRIVQLLK